MALSKCDTRTNQQGRELVDHGTVMFPIACYHDDLAKDKVPWHWHDELETIVVEKGTAIVAVDGEKYTVKQGDGVFINAGVLHAVWSEDGAVGYLHSVVFHPRLVGSGVDSVFWQRYMGPLVENRGLKALYFEDGSPWQMEVIQAIETAWQECVSEQPGYEFRVRNALSQLVFLLSNVHPAAPNRPSEKALRDEKRIKLMLQYIQEHYAEELNTPIIARTALVSESECLRCFRNTIGIPPIQYVKQFRIQKATELLMTSEQKITDIGVQCGFANTSYFIKTFREIRGCTPIEYRKNS